jgi:hypothetical protein
MSATIVFTIPEPAAGEDVPVSVVWYDSADGSGFASIGEKLLNDQTPNPETGNLTYDPVTGTYSWELAAADTSRYQLIKTKSAGGIECFSGVLMPPLPSNPVLQSVYGSAKEFGVATWSVGDTVEMTMTQDQMVDGVILEPVTRTVLVDANGMFVLTPDKGVKVKVQVKNQGTGKIYFSKSFTVSSEDQKNIKDY